MQNYKSKSKLDGIFDFRRVVRERLARLKQQILTVEVSSSREILTLSRRLLFRLGLILPRDWQRRVFPTTASALVLFLLLSSFALIGQREELGKKILGTASTGFELARQGELGLLGQSFEQARVLLQEGGGSLLQILKLLPQGQDLERLMAAGRDLTEALDLLLPLGEQLPQLTVSWDESRNTSGQEFYLALKGMRPALVRALEELSAAVSSLQEVSPQSLPEAVVSLFQEAAGKLKEATRVLSQLERLQYLLLNLLGGEEKTYLLIFQNNAEARPSGGFLGTYGILHFRNGRVEIEKIESIYALDGQLQEAIAAPGPLQRRLTNYWGVRDSNWFVDFPHSARKILSFLEKTTGILADGIISFTPDVFEELLRISGPIAMPEYAETLTAENFRQVVQYKTSLDYDLKLNQPKKFLADFAPRLLLRMQTLDVSQRLEVLEILARAAAKKHILMFSTDPSLQETITGLGLAAEIKRVEADYLAIFHSNVGGGKTDINIDQRLDQEVKIARDGLAIVNLKITRTHHGFEEKFLPQNLDYMRILVPAGSRLLAASGFDDFELKKSIYEGAVADLELAFWDEQIRRDETLKMYIGREAGYTVFSNWLELRPGESKTVALTYQLPKLPEKSYRLLLQTQPGSKPFEFHLVIDYPGNLVYYHPEEFSLKPRGLELRQTISTDRFYGVILE